MAKRGQGLLYDFQCVLHEMAEPRWEIIGDEPMRPYFIEHYLDEEGERLLRDEKLHPPA